MPVVAACRPAGCGVAIPPYDQSPPPHGGGYLFGPRPYGRGYDKWGIVVAGRPSGSTFSWISGLSLVGGKNTRWDSVSAAWRRLPSLDSG